MHAELSQRVDNDSVTADHSNHMMLSHSGDGYISVVEIIDLVTM